MRGKSLHRPLSSRPLPPTKGRSEVYRTAVITLVSSVVGSIITTFIGLTLLAGQERIRVGEARKSEILAAYARMAWSGTLGSQPGQHASDLAARDETELLRTISQLTIFSSGTLLSKISDYQAACATTSDSPSCQCKWADVVAVARQEAGASPTSSEEVVKLFWGGAVKCGA